MSEDKRVVLVTGGSSGIGRATALEYAKLDYKVAITGRCRERLDDTLEALKEISVIKDASNFLSLQVEFEDIEQVDKVILETITKFKRLDILINNAGSPGKKLTFMEPDFFECFQSVLQVNLVAPTRIVQLVLPELLKTKGVIINVSSISDRIPRSHASYSVAKAGLSMLTKSLANALDGKQVRVVTVSPGPILTNIAQSQERGLMTTLERVGHPHEVARTIVFLTSKKASFIHGSTIYVDGGCGAKYAGLYDQTELL